MLTSHLCTLPVGASFALAVHLVLRPGGPTVTINNDRDAAIPASSLDVLKSTFDTLEASVGGRKEGMDVMRRPPKLSYNVRL